MLFNSLHFVVFFVVITCIYYLIPFRFQWQLLLTASCYFYMAFVPVYIFILGFTIFIDFYAGLYIERTTGHTRKVYLIASLLANIGVLSVFKYYNFLNENLSVILSSFNLTNYIPSLTILLPIGLSFHTFQAMSYTIEVYRGNQRAEKHLGIYALYVMFYPQLVAGPIERPQNVLYQFHEKHDFKPDQISEGLKLIAWGLFKKVVIADRLAITVNNVYDNPTHFEGLPLIIATVMFAFQIYCDFSGYSDIALGTAQTLGFRLMKNFDRPYFSTSLSEFWTRWHISLSTWFRDYLYIPLGGNRVTKSRWYINLFITFLVSGFWHGANWTYIIWGSLNGLYLITENVTYKARLTISHAVGLQSWPILRKIVGILVTFCLTCLAWVFFRARSVRDANFIISHLFVNIKESLTHVKPSELGSTLYDWVIGLGCLSILLLIEYAQGQFSIKWWMKQQPVYIRMGLYFALIMLVLLFGVFDVQEQFIYFQF